jgi:hypothetical protein
MNITQNSVLEDNQNDGDFKIQQRNHKGSPCLPTMALKTNNSIVHPKQPQKAHQQVMQSVSTSRNLLSRATPCTKGKARQPWAFQLLRDSRWQRPPSMCCNLMIYGLAMACVRSWSRPAATPRAAAGWDHRSHQWWSSTSPPLVTACGKRGYMLLCRNTTAWN